jgi:hypothetical protein
MYGAYQAACEAEGSIVDKLRSAAWYLLRRASYESHTVRARCLVCGHDDLVRVGQLRAETLEFTGEWADDAETPEGAWFCDECNAWRTSSEVSA